MKVPFSWLKDYVDIDVSAEELQKKLFSCGFEVEELTYLGKDVTGVYVGQITKIEKHPNADKLQVCQLNFGEKIGSLQICTAATNVFVGAKVPAALNGATVWHEGEIIKIKNGKLRGEDSLGMMCSGEELGINNDYYPGAEVYGILILDENTPIGEDIRKVVGLDDYLFDIAVTANRPDCQCVLGIAREVAALLKKPLKLPDFSYTTEKVEDKVKMSVEVKDTSLCPRYIGHYVSDIKMQPSPAWLKRRLALCDIRSISNIVDITNFVLLEMGQPMHAFDLNTLKNRSIIVRRAKDGEKIQTLDDKIFTLNKENLLICDGDTPVALAGIMGGKNSEIKPNTQKVFFESAKFARDNIRKTSRSLGQSSDSSSRYEKGVDAYTTYYGMARALHLVQQLNCGKVSDVHIDINNAEVCGKVMQAKASKINALLGIEVPVQTMIDILVALHFEVKLEKDNDTMQVTVPAFREDMDGCADLAEEIIREYGYEHLKPTFLPSATITNGGLNEKQKQCNRFKAELVKQGFYEAMNYSFYSPKDLDLIHLPQEDKLRQAIKVLNPIGEDLSLMRTILLPSMIGNVVRNIRRGNDSGKLFELSNVYLTESLPLEMLPKEQKHLTMAVWGEGDFFTLKGAIEALAEVFRLNLTFEKTEKTFLHPGVSALVKMGQKEVGFIGELDPAIAKELSLDKKIYLAELNYEELEKKFNTSIRYKGMAKFPPVNRDLSLVVKEEITCGEIEECILHAVKAVKKVELFDVYRGGQVPSDMKSMTFSLTFEGEVNADKPLTPETVDGFIKKILGALKFKLGIEIRA